MSDHLSKLTAGAGSTSVYRWCLTAYPPRYRSEHGADILATIEDAHLGQSRLSVRECAALVLGGVQRRSADASANGRVGAVLSALRGAAMVMLLVNASVVITGIIHQWIAPAPPAVPVGVINAGVLRGDGVGALMWTAVLLSVAAVGLLGAGLRRWSGLALVASGLCVAGAANWLTGFGIRNSSLFASGGMPFSAAFGDGRVPLADIDFSFAVTLLVPAALLMFLPSRPAARVSRLRGLTLAFGALVVLVFLSVLIPWLGQNPGPALLVVIVAASVFAPIDGRISLAASAVLFTDLPLLMRALQSADILPATASNTPWIPTILIGAVALAAWGWFWTERRAYAPAHLAN
jgi:hypothetical protein